MSGAPASRRTSSVSTASPVQTRSTPSTTAGDADVTSTVTGAALYGPPSSSVALTRIVFGPPKAYVCVAALRLPGTSSTAPSPQSIRQEAIVSVPGSLRLNWTSSGTPACPVAGAVTLTVGATLRT